MEKQRWQKPWLASLGEKASKEREMGYKGHSRNALLRPREIRPDLLCRLHSVGKVRASRLHPSLRELLQFLEFALLGVQFAGSGGLSLAGYLGIDWVL